MPSRRYTFGRTPADVVEGVGLYTTRLSLRDTSYSGADIKIVVHVEPFLGENGDIQTTKELVTVQTLSYSVFRENGQVRALGHVYRK